MRAEIDIRFDDNSIIYVLIHQKSKHFVANKQNSIKLSRQGLEGELKFVKTSINLISTPYMDYCKLYFSEYFNIFI